MDQSNDNLATLMGGKDLAVTHRDGTTATVKVRQLEVELYPDLLKLLENEQGQIELYCDKPEGWAKTLTITSHTEVVTLAEQLNKSFFESWVRRRFEKMEMLRPGMIDKMFEGMAPKDQTSPNTLRKLPPSAVLGALKR